MISLLKIIILTMCVVANVGCAVAPPTVVSTKSYIGRDFTYNKNIGYKKIVFLLPSNINDIREVSDYRGVYGALVKEFSSWSSPFYNLKCIADWDNNSTAYFDKENILVKVKLNNYGSNVSKDSTTCVSIETSFNVYPFNNYSQFIYDGANCSGITDVRFLSQTYIQRLNYAWNNEYYATHFVQFTSVDSVNYSEAIDNVLGFRR